MQPRIETKVVLPEPDGPWRIMTSPASIAIDNPLSTITASRPSRKRLGYVMRFQYRHRHISQVRNINAGSIDATLRKDSIETATPSEIVPKKTKPSSRPMRTA
jgi:hypothetical protein